MHLIVNNFIIFGLSFLFQGSHGSYDDSIILITDTLIKGIYGVSSRTETIYSIAVKRVLNPIGIHYNEVNERIYWSDVLLKEIRSTSISGHDDVIICSLDNSSIPDGLAVDPVSSLIFYTDAGNQLIALMDLDGSNHAIIVSKDIEKPRAIILDQNNGKIYWSDWGIIPKIETANYDGTDRKALVTSGIIWPNALTIDFAEKWMYWGDAGTHKIERSRLDGSERKVIFYDEKAHYFSMLVYSNKLFYTDWQRRSVMAISLDGDDVPINIGNESFSRLNDISRLKQKPTYLETNACSKNKGGCSHICIPRPKGKYACLCPTGFILKEQSSCVKELLSRKDGRCAPLKAKNFTTVTPEQCLTHASPTGTVCEVKCPAGFIYDGYKHEVQCDAEGNWNDIIYDCIDIASPIIHNCPQDWQLITTEKGLELAFVTWDNIFATDNSGIKPLLYSSMQSGVTVQEGEYTINIFAVDHAGHFDGCEFSFIVKVHRCVDDPVPEYGYAVSGQCPNYYGAKCTIACNTGYQLSIDKKYATIECDRTSDNKTLWKLDRDEDFETIKKIGYFACIPTKCPQITSPNTDVTGCSDPLSFGSVCEQTCSKGFERITGSSIRICKHDGSWSGEDLTCKQKTVECPKLTPMPGVDVIGCSPPYEVNSVCEQTCNVGYVSENRGSGLRLCKQDGTWSGVDIRCIKSSEGESSKTTPQSKDSNDRVDTTYTSILIGGAVLVFSILLINFGIFVYLQKLHGNIQSKENGIPTGGNIEHTNQKRGTEHEVEETSDMLPKLSELKDTAH